MKQYVIRTERFAVLGKTDTLESAVEFIQDWIEQNGFGEPIALDIDTEGDGVDAVYIDPIQGMQILSTWKE